jgi:putative MATE family efflux protein
MFVVFVFVFAVITVDTQSFSEAFSGISLATINGGATTTTCNIFRGEPNNDCKNGHRQKRLLEGEARLFSAPENQSNNQLVVETNSDANSPETGNETDTGRTILALAIPALAAMLVDPLLTIADTAFVGRYSDSPYELAGMGSASALLTFSFYVFNFLCTATTPMVASKRASGDEAGALAVGGQAVSLALGLGTILSVALILLQEPLLGLMGAGGNQYASDFLTIRALAAPAVFCISASTGILRGYLDTKTPIFVLFLANVVNFGLDVALITVAGFGPKGAAIATTTAEWISAILFLLVLAGKLPSADGELGKKDTAPSVEDTPTIVPSLSIPPYIEIEPLIVASSSVFFRSLVLQLFLTAAAALVTREGVGGGIASATTTTTTESMVISTSDNGASFISAHQIAFQIWMLCSYISDALAAASQGLVADAIGREASRDIRDISKTVFVYSSYLGLLLAGVLFVGFYPTDFLVNFFTSDEGTQRALLEIAALLVVSQPLNSLVFAADGVLQGASEFPYQAKSMALSGLVGSIIFVGLQSTGKVDNLFGVWTALIGLQMMRGITSAVKIVDENGPINLLAEPSLAAAQEQER